jgi:hypothetical protein
MNKLCYPPPNYEKRMFFLEKSNQKIIETIYQSHKAKKTPNNCVFKPIQIQQQVLYKNLPIEMKRV